VRIAAKLFKVRGQSWRS